MNCGVLQCVVVFGAVLQHVAVCCNVAADRPRAPSSPRQFTEARRSANCVAVCCSVLQCVAACCSVLQCGAVCCSVLHRFTMCRSVTADRPRAPSSQRRLAEARRSAK